MGSPLAKWVIAEFVRGLPARARKALLVELCTASSPSDGYEAFQRLGQRYGIADLRVPGDYGEIEGALADTAILATYSQTHCWAANFNRILEKFFAEHHGGTYIDVGANIGLTTIPIARHAAVACKAFEPEPQTFRYLTANLRRNCPDGNVETYNLALFDRKGTAAFELAERNLGDHRIRLTSDDGSFGEARRRVIKVPTERLDDVLGIADLAQPIVVKFDTQGAECRVLDGGRTLLEHAALFAFEFWPYGIRRMDNDPESLISFVGEWFGSGAILADDPSSAPVWCPIATITDSLTGVASKSHDEAYATRDVIVAK
jgi:FkbM family methyltransferase